MRVFVGLAMVCFLLVLFREKWLMLIGDFLIVEDDLKPADVIHVIAGDEYRLDYAIHLYQRGYGKKIYLTGGGWCPIHHVYHGEAWRERALDLGVPSTDVIINDEKITSTYMEAEKLKAWIENSPYPIRSVIVISDPFHMRRARWTYERVLGKNIEVLMAPVPIEQTPFQRAWWRDWESRKYVKDEYEKMIYYIFRYQISRGKFQEWLASLDVN